MKIKRSLLWVLAAYCVGILLRDRLRLILWAVFLLCLGFLFVYIKYRMLVGGCKSVPLVLQSRNRILMCLPFALLLGAVLGGRQAADYPIDAVLKAKIKAVACGQVRSITRVKSGFCMELADIEIRMSEGIVTAEEAEMYFAGRTEIEEKIEKCTSDTVKDLTDECYKKGKLLLYCKDADGIFIGNYIKAEGTAAPFAIPENPGQFDERSYYRANRMCCKFNAETVTVIRGGKDFIREWCRQARMRLDKIYEEILPEKHAGIISAVLLGDKAELEAETKELYQKNGIAHILAISGLHVSLLGMGLFALVRKIGSPLIPAAVATMLILTFYGCLTEFGISTQRAVGMLLLAMFARILGRTYDSRSACALCALVILLRCPMQLYQVGFQLSFAAAFGISLFSMELTRMKLVKGKTGGEKLKLALLSGATTQLLTAPIILNCFYELPVYAVFLNLPVVALLSALISLSIAAGLAGMLSYGLGRFLAGGVYYILELFELLCELAWKLPSPIWLYGKPGKLQLIGYFIVLAAFFKGAPLLGKRYRHHPKEYRYRRYAFSVFLLLPLLLLLPNGREIKQGYAVDFLSVGQGDCSVVRTGEKTYLIDCGSSSVKSVGEYRLEPYLKYHGISELEAAFLTHPDGDHTNGLTELLEKTNSPKDCYRGSVRIKNIVLAEAFAEESFGAIEKASGRAGPVEGIWKASGEENKGFSKVIRLAEEKEIPVVWFESGDMVLEKELCFICLHPSREYPVTDVNDASLVLLLEEKENREASVLFTGDIGMSGEKCVMETMEKLGWKMQKKSEKTDRGTGRIILKVAHHGSKGSSSERFLNLLQPDIAVISCGRDNRYGHPHDEILERLEKEECFVLSTPEYGAVTVEAGKKLSVHSVLQ